MSPVLHGTDQTGNPAYTIDLTADRYFGESQQVFTCSESNDDAGVDADVVLVVVGAVIESSEKIVGLDQPE